LVALVVFQVFEQVFVFAQVTIVVPLTDMVMLTMLPDDTLAVAEIAVL
jgi:hypothetical protein